jgi:hypothetical protein
MLDFFAKVQNSEMSKIDKRHGVSTNAKTYYIRGLK